MWGRGRQENGPSQGGLGPCATPTSAAPWVVEARQVGQVLPTPQAAVSRPSHPLERIQAQADDRGVIWPPRQPPLVSRRRGNWHHWPAAGAGNERPVGVVREAVQCHGPYLGTGCPITGPCPLRPAAASSSAAPPSVLTASTRPGASGAPSGRHEAAAAWERSGLALTHPGVQLQVPLLRCAAPQPPAT